MDEENWPIHNTFVIAFYPTEVHVFEMSNKFAGVGTQRSTTKMEICIYVSGIYAGKRNTRGIRTLLGRVEPPLKYSQEERADNASNHWTDFQIYMCNKYLYTVPLAMATAQSPKLGTYLMEIVYTTGW